jgi:hypothetical protein
MTARNGMPASQQPENTTRSVAALAGSRGFPRIPSSPRAALPHGGNRLAALDADPCPRRTAPCPQGPVISAPSLLALAPQPEEALPGRAALERKAMLTPTRRAGSRSGRPAGSASAGTGPVPPSIGRPGGARVIAKRLNADHVAPPPL